MLVLLHSGHPVTWGAWHFEPTVISLSFIAVSFYIYGILTVPGAFSPLRTASFLAGSLLMFFALVSPLDAAADRLLSMHMLQHVFLTTIGPPLMLLGLSPALMRSLLSVRWLRQPLRLLTYPLFAGTLFVVNMWFWHVPGIYDLALTNLWVHVGMHIAFMTTGLLFWWPVIQPAPELARYGEGARLLYLVATGFPMALLAMLFFASGSVIYPYYEPEPHLWGISPLDDQQVAGLIMGGLGEFASFVAVTLLFLRFLERDEAQAVSAQEAAAAGPLDAG
jgi:putative membrane protein